MELPIMSHWVGSTALLNNTKRSLRSSSCELLGLSVRPALRAPALCALFALSTQSVRDVCCAQLDPEDVSCQRPKIHWCPLLSVSLLDIVFVVAFSYDAPVREVCSPLPRSSLRNPGYTTQAQHAGSAPEQLSRVATLLQRLCCGLQVL